MNPGGDSSRTVRQGGAAKFGEHVETLPEECHLKAHRQDFSLHCFQPGANSTEKKGILSIRFCDRTSGNWIENQQFRQLIVIAQEIKKQGFRGFRNER